MKDYLGLISRATANDARLLVMEASDIPEISSSQFAEIANIARRRLKELESMENGDSGLHPAGSGGDCAVRSESPVKEKGWPECFRCDLWRPLSQQCGSINKDGLSPCGVMSRKMYKYLRRED